MPKRKPSTEKPAPAKRPSACVRLAGTHKQISGYVPLAEYAAIKSAADGRGMSVFAFMRESAVSKSGDQVHTVEG